MFRHPFTLAPNNEGYTHRLRAPAGCRAPRLSSGILSGPLMVRGTLEALYFPRPRCRGTWTVEVRFVQYARGRPRERVIGSARFRVP